MTAINYSEKLVQAMRSLHSSLQLKDVLAAALNQITIILDVRKVAIFLCDNESLSLKLMSASGYSQESLAKLQLLNFGQDSIFKNVLKNRQPIAINDIRQAPDISAGVMHLEKSSLHMALPLIAGNLMVGTMLIDDMPEPNPKRLEFLKDFCQALAQALSQAITFGQSEFERKGLEKLHQILLELSEPLDTAELEELICNSALALSGTKHCALLTTPKAGNTFLLSNFKGFDGTSLSHFDLHKQETLAGHCLASGRIEYIADATSIQQKLPLSSRGGFFHSALAVPLKAADAVIAILMIFSEEPAAFAGNQLQLLEKLATHTGKRLLSLSGTDEENQKTMHDPSTSLYTPYFLQDSLSKEIERSERHKHELALLRLDIDQIDHMNEMLGTEHSKRAIVHVAEILRSSLREMDIACRWGSEDFAILLPETPRPNAHEVAERLRQQIRSASIPGVGMVTVSIGIAAYPANGLEIQALLKQAEQALIVAKYAGKDTVRLAEEIPDSLRNVSWDQLVNEARLAIINERQARLENRLGHEGNYAPWMRALPGWTGRKKST